MKELITVIAELKKKAIISCSKLSFLVSLFLFLPIAWMPGLVPACFGQSPWTQKADMHSIRQGHSSGILDSIIYAVGGVQYNTPSTHFNALKSMEFYDPDQDAWMTKAEMDTGRVQFPTCVFEGKIYAIGGAQSVEYDPLKSIEAYDPETDTWTYVTDMPRARMGHTASLVNGKIYMIGGRDSNVVRFPAEIDVWDPLTNTWDTTKADLPTPRWWSASAALDGKIYVLGGENSPPWPGLHTVEAYDPETDTWATKADMIRPRKLFTACSLDGKIFVFGGVSGNCEGALSSIEVYDPLTDTWMEGTPSSEPLVMAAAAPFNDRVYISGGTFLICPPDVQGILRIYNPNEIVSIPDVATDWNQSGVLIYPNPTNSLLTIETVTPDMISIEITSLNGQLILSKEIEGTTHQLDLSSFQTGVYFITFRNKDYMTTRKIIKLKLF